MTLIGSSLTNFGVVLLKKHTTELPDGTRRERGSLGAYFTGLKGQLGLALNVLGFGLFLLATTSHSAPISVLRPLSAFGLAVVAVLAVFYLREGLVAREWLGICLLAGGVIMLSASTEPPPLEQLYIHLPQYLGYVIGAIVVSVTGLVLLPFLHSRGVVEVFYGFVAGVLYGVGYLNTKAVSLAWQEDRPELMGLALLLMGGGMLSGFAVFLRSLYHARAVVVKSVNFVTNQAVAAAGGMFCLGEQFPHDPAGFTLRILGYGAILSGFLILLGVRRNHFSETPG